MKPGLLIRQTLCVLWDMAGCQDKGRELQASGRSACGRFHTQNTTTHNARRRRGEGSSPTRQPNRQQLPIRASQLCNREAVIGFCAGNKRTVQQLQPSPTGGGSNPCVGGCDAKSCRRAAHPKILHRLNDIRWCGTRQDLKDGSDAREELDINSAKYTYQELPIVL